MYYIPMLYAQSLRVPTYRHKTSEVYICFIPITTYRHQKIDFENKTALSNLLLNLLEQPANTLFHFLPPTFFPI